MNNYEKPVEFKIKRSESKDICPDCGAKMLHNLYSEECSDFDNCDYYREYEDEETKGDEKPTRYDYVMGLIIE